MTALVVYESMFGNTRDIAEAIAFGLAEGGTAQIVEVGEAKVLPDDLDLLVVGGPTHAFGMSRKGTRDDARMKTTDGPIVSQGIGLREWIAGLDSPARQVSVATFDTKVRHPRLPGSAAKSAMKALKSHGFRKIAAPETFDVDGMTGPLLDGEVERARQWGASLARASQPAG